MITEVSIRCQENPEVRIWRIPANTPQYTTEFQPGQFCSAVLRRTVEMSTNGTNHVMHPLCVCGLSVSWCLVRTRQLTCSQLEYCHLSFQVLQCIPDNWSLGFIHQFLTSSVRKTLNRSRMTRIERMLLRGHNLALRLQMFHLTKDPFYISDDRQVVWLFLIDYSPAGMSQLSFVSARHYFVLLPWNMCISERSRLSLKEYVAVGHKRKSISRGGNSLSLLAINRLLLPSLIFSRQCNY